MQHRRERPTPRRQTHPPETPQTHLHPPPSPALSPNFKHSLLRAREASQSQPPFRKPAPFILPGIHRPLSLYLYPSLFLSLPFPLALSLSPSPSTFSPSSLTVATLSYTTRLDPTARPRAPPPATTRPPTYNSYVPSDPRAISKIIPYILELGVLSSSVEDRAARVGRRERTRKGLAAAAAATATATASATIAASAEAVVTCGDGSLGTRVDARGYR